MLIILNYVSIFFIMTNSSGYTPPLDVRKFDMSCGLPGSVIGVQIDRNVNPSKVFFPDPGIPIMHCVVDISQKVNSLPEGEYHIATTEMGELNDPTPNFMIDPHTSQYFTIVKSTVTYPSKPGQVKLKGQQ